MDTAGGRAVSHHTDQPQRRAFRRALNQEAVPAETSLAQSMSPFIESHPCHTRGPTIYISKRLMAQCLEGEKRAVDGDEREEAGNEGKERCSFDSFTSHSRHAWLICLFFFLLFTPPHPPLLTWCCCIIDSSKIQFLSTISASIPKRHLERGQKGGSINKMDQIVSSSVAPACSMRPPLPPCFKSSKTDVITIVHM